MLTQAPPQQNVAGRLAVEIRRLVIEMSGSPNGVHIGGSMSIADLLAVLYGEVLRQPSGAGSPLDRDYLILSKGQACAALYAALAATGVLPKSEIETYAEQGSRLAGHPMKTLPGVDFSTGSLGHGLSLGLGVALAGRRYGHDNRAFVILGDGELQEGSNWEAAMAAAHLGVDNLTAIVDRNGLQISGRTEDCMALEPLTGKWASFGWRVLAIDGHDHDQIRQALGGPVEPGRPTAVIARTIKARGVPGLQDTKKSHSATLDRDAQRLALAALESEL
ncbi:MAG TPA: 1-deoxy-D-xylulose-5-phosphate synthase N-terminal domain-containing protein [Actinophytocola sp.]|uniref:transketolase n=1 Tax=Actinophytocola sp. TaxID=1872138 RepID=UPI002DDCC5A6|nr:1-deoxy-D-xylulose-5-phosphate synthase N-terminal domain-containing protein [Actinophytocola sp.]HEV2780534.1 1-deoxy-D-xylulose-5-phosphate synthase N-terminal domain-containing protein [Actinophytocola sp.]